MGYNFLLQKQICVCLIDFHRDIRLEVWMFCQFSEGNKQQNTHKNMAALGNFGCYPWLMHDGSCCEAHLINPS